MPKENLVDDKTHIRCKIIIEILGKPKEHVEKTVRMYADKIKNDPELTVINTEFADLKEKEGLWATFTEMDMVVKGIPKLIAFCFDYMPSSIEITKPEEFAMKKPTIENFINDLQARLHQIDMIVKKQKNENEFLIQNLNKAVSNVILISLASGNLDKENLSKATGIQDKELEIFLDKLVKDNKIALEGESYSLVK
jgi:hypothetical protein|tara:strand:- start:911 stop:1498 length:588 start_codon:yes stop_codon:yes gene_type:complete